MGSSHRASVHNMIYSVVFLTILFPLNIDTLQPYFCPQGQELRYDRIAGRTRCTVVDPFTVPPWERPITAPPRLPDFTRATPLPGRKKKICTRGLQEFGL